MSHGLYRANPCSLHGWVHDCEAHDQEEDQNRHGERIVGDHGAPDGIHGQAHHGGASQGPHVDTHLDQEPEPRDAEHQSQQDGQAGLNAAFCYDQAEHPCRAESQGLEHSDLADALEDGHQHRIQDQDAYGDVDDEEDNDHQAAHRIQHGGNRGHQLAPGLHVQPGRDEANRFCSLLDIHVLRPADDELMGSPLHGKEIPEGLDGHEDTGAVRRIAYALEHAPNPVQVIGYASVRSLTERHQFITWLDPESPGEAPSDHHLFRALANQPIAQGDMHVDVAHLGIPLRAHPPERHPGRGFARRSQPPSQQPRTCTEAERFNPFEQVFGFLDPGVQGRVVPEAQGKDLHVPQFQVQDVPLHAREVAFHEARVEDHYPQGEGHGRHGDDRAPPVAPDIPPSHLEEAHSFPRRDSPCTVVHIHWDRYVVIL